jgi:subtilase family serine protease
MMPDGNQPLTASPANAGSYGPAEFHTAYSLPCTPGGTIASICPTPTSFGPETIAIVDAGSFTGGNSALETSLADYDTYYGIPTCSIANSCLSVINQNGATSPLPANAGWSNEIALDVETAHMVCQTCKIALVEANDTVDTDLAAAESEAASLKPVSISNSWGGNTDDPSLDNYFDYPGIAVVAATGDLGSVSNGASWPSDNPDVVSVAGTTLQLGVNNSWGNETVWVDSGGGCSTYYPAPTWQTSLSDWASNGCGANRSFGDLSADADPNTGAAINVNGTWYQIGGTSLATPLIAGMFALSGGIPPSVIGSSVPYAKYSSTAFHDITSGNDCTSLNTTHCTASIGFDTPSGLGSPNGLSGLISLPSQPNDVVAKTINQNSIQLSWIAGSGNPSGYMVYRDGTQIATTSTTTYTDGSLIPNTSYDYQVVAYDSSGNTSLPSIAVSAFTAYPADINEDGHIDLLDLSLLAASYGQCSPSVGRADINQDGCVNLLDLSLLAQAYGSE